MIWFGWVLWYINHCSGFNSKSSLKIYMIWFGWVLRNINHYRLFNSKSSLDMDVRYIWFDWVGFYGISTIVGYLIHCRSNPLYTYILDIYDFVLLVLWHINHWRLFNAKPCLYLYINVWFSLVGFYGISTILGYLMPNPLYDIYILFCWFYGISTIEGYLMPNPVYTYI